MSGMSGMIDRRLTALEARTGGTIEFGAVYIGDKLAWIKEGLTEADLDGTRCVVIGGPEWAKRNETRS